MRQFPEFREKQQPTLISSHHEQICTLGKSIIFTKSPPPPPPPFPRPRPSPLHPNFQLFNRLLRQFRDPAKFCPAQRKRVAFHQSPLGRGGACLLRTNGIEEGAEPQTQTRKASPRPARIPKLDAETVPGAGASPRPRERLGPMSARVEQTNERGAGGAAEGDGPMRAGRLREAGQ